MLSETDVQAALNETKSKFGKLDAVVNCAGIGIAVQTYNFNKKKPHVLEDFQKVLLVSNMGSDVLYAFKLLIFIQRHLGCILIMYSSSANSRQFYLKYSGITFSILIFMFLTCESML